VRIVGEGTCGKGARGSAAKLFDPLAPSSPLLAGPYNFAQSLLSS